jgi:8-oxo-dGTP pyrophosphatase MutT (NUDIX family)
MSRRFVVAAVVIRDETGRILLVRKAGTSRFMLPGGKIEEGETPAECALREANEELGVVLDPAMLTWLGDWEAPAANEPDHSVHGYIYAHPVVAGIAVQREIEELIWLDPATAGERDDLAPLFQHRVLPAL